MAVRRAQVDEALERVRAVAEAPRSPKASEVLTEALSSKHPRVVTAAAHLIKARQLEGFTRALQAAYLRFLEDPVKRDPGCQAKLAVVEALDFTETMEDETFVAASGLVQLEPAWGPPVDTAAPCRARAVLALARIGHPDVALIAGTLLADPAAPVRVAAADALGNSGVRATAGVLLHKLAVGDDDPLVELACMSGVLALAPEVALTRFVPALRGESAERRELAALCLGQSGRADALQALKAALDDSVTSRERAPLLQGLGLHRSDGALEVLLEVVGGSREADAAAAIRALGPRRFEPGLRARVEEAMGGRAELAPALAEAFKDA